jgi:hypothetical protein
MAGVTVNSGKPVAYDDCSDWPQDRWKELADERKRYIERELNWDCRCVVRAVREAEEMAPVLGYASGKEMVEKHYQLDPEEIGIVVRWLELNDPEEAIGIEEVQALAKQSESTDRDEKGRFTSRSDNITTVHRGTERTYTLRRLARDRPDLVSRIRDGELSANAAAIEAGFRKRTVTLIADPERWAKKAMEIFDRGEIDRLIAALNTRPGSKD